MLQLLLLLLLLGSKQAGYQTATLFITLGVAIVGGILTGFLMKQAKRIRVILAKDFFNDRTFWNLPSDYDMVVRSDGGQHHNTLTPSGSNEDLEVLKKVSVDKPKAAVQRKISNNSINKNNNNNSGKKAIEMEVFDAPENSDSDSDESDSEDDKHSINNPTSKRSPQQQQRQSPVPSASVSSNSTNQQRQLQQNEESTDESDSTSNTRSSSE